MSLEPISVRFYGRQGTVLQRTQLLIILCWAATLHKVQGLSFDAAVLDLGDRVFEPGMAYVALSCVRTLDGVALSSFEPRKIKANKRVHAEMARLRQNSTPHNTYDGETPSSHLLVESSSPTIRSSQPTNSIPSAASSVPSVQSPEFQAKSPKNSVPKVVETVLSLQQSLQGIVDSNNPSLDLIEEWVTCHEGDIAGVLMEVVNQPHRVCLSSCHQMDLEVQEQLLPAFTSYYAPVYTTGSENCSS